MREVTAPSLDALLASVAQRAAEVALERFSEERQGEHSGPALEDRAGLARRLKTSVATVDRLRTEGMPTLWICDAPRFDVAEVVAWLKARAV